MKKIKGKFTETGNASQKYRKRGETSLAKFVSFNGKVTGTLMLDPRRMDGDYSQMAPVAIRIAYAGKKVFLRIGKSYIGTDWIELCECEKLSRNKKASERKELKNQMDKVATLVNQLIDEGNFSLRKLQERYQGKKDDDSTIYSIWETFILSKRDEGKAGTARCSEDILKRFVRDMGKEVSLSDISRNFIMDWVKVMRQNDLSTTSIGISLRTFRTIVNICIDHGLIKGNTKEMFKDTGYNKVCSRKHEFLDVSTMRRLFDFWERNEAKDDKGKELFFPKEKHAVFRDLGLFLFMYLGDGQNLADTLRLTYDSWYFATHGKQLRFLRHKTRDRNESISEVTFPITKELQNIIDKYGNEPKLDKPVFSIMSKWITPEQEVWVIQRYNRYIREYMAKVAELLGMELRPSSTWARHSFATNLNNSGIVPYKYISDSMGHSGNGDITSNYIGAYPLDKMLEYNWYLLNEERQNKATDKQMVLELLKKMSEKDRKELFASL